MLQNPAQFIKAGKAIFTIQNVETGNRFTYKAKKADKDDVWFISVLNGPDNYSNYQYIGCLFGDDFRLTKKSKITRDAPSYKAFAWTWTRLQQNNLPFNVEIHHEGRCGRCGRRLTVPSSIETGYGEECAKIIGG
ncbi:hypothetical protein Dvar_45680 [Desulfosarcina variabilis str. Montpellier]|uniref:DUF6011 domain-containing protein n=1 Tax=Desulfosarcina variabilis TaxID=2300 RepID=UPI003AFA4564